MTNFRENLNEDQLGDYLKRVTKYIQNEVRKTKKIYQREFGVGAFDGTSIKRFYREDVKNTKDEGWYEMVYNPPSNFIFITMYGKLHRVGGPAHTTRYSLEWYQNGKRHRTDGPAIVSLAAGRVEFWVNGKRMDREEFLQHFDIRSEP